MSGPGTPDAQLMSECQTSILGGEAAEEGGQDYYSGSFCICPECPLSQKRKLESLLQYSGLPKAQRGSGLN